MQKLLIMFLWASLLLGVNCTKNEPMEPVSNNTNLKIVWKKPFNIGQLAGSETPLITENGALFTVFTSGDPEELWMLDKNTGEEKWRWQGDNGGFGFFSNQHPFTFMNELVCAGNGYFSIDLSDGTETCRYQANNAVWSARIGETIFTTERPNDTTRTIVKTDKNCNSVTLFKETSVTPFWDINGILPFVDEAGDTLVYYSTNKYFWGIDTGETYFICRNITKNEVIHREFNPKGHMVYSPVINGDNIILVFQNIVTCLNRKTFEKIWEQDIIGGPAYQINIYDNKLIVQDDGEGYIYAINPINGVILWKAKTGTGISMPNYCKGHIYFRCASDGLLYGIRTSDGKKIWEEKSPDTEQNSGTSFAFGVGVDTITNRIYVSTFNNAYCFKGIE
jgi:outer membrane protein assembly factor BamB